MLAAHWVFIYYTKDWADWETTADIVKVSKQEEPLNILVIVHVCAIWQVLVSYALNATFVNF